MITSTFEHHSTRDHVVRAALITTIGLLFWGQFDPDHEDLIRHLDDAVLSIFICEVAMRLKAEIETVGWGFWRNGWLMFDLVVTVVAALPMGADVIAARVVRVAKLAHMGRHLPHLLTWLRYLSGLRLLRVNTMNTMKVAATVAGTAVVSLAGAPVVHADPPDVLAGITVAPHSHRYDYRRAAFGEGWGEDSNGCDLRDDILNRDLTDKTYVWIKRCPDAVTTGTLNDPYTGKTITFTRGPRSSESVQIDHIVPLAYAWDEGAWAWPADKRAQLYLDPAELLAVDGQANQAKGDAPPGKWMPPNAGFDCQYATKFTAVLRAYQLPIDPGSVPVLQQAAATCPTTP